MHGDMSSERERRSVSSLAGAGRHATFYMATILRPGKVDTGVQAHGSALTRCGGQMGVDVRPLTPFDGEPLLAYSLGAMGRLIRPLDKELWVWWYRSSRVFLLRRHMRAMLDPRMPAIVYAQDLQSAQAAIDLRDAGYPVEVVLNIHSSVTEADEWVANGYLSERGRHYGHVARTERMVLPRVDRLVFPSEFVAQDVRSRIPEAASVPGWCIPNFVPRIEASATPQGESAELISIGPLVPNKNHEFLIRMLAHAHRMGRRYRLSIIGEGPLRRHLTSLAKELGLGGHVMLAGYVPNAARLLQRHRVYVHAARMENCCLSVLEAFAAGRPVLAAPNGGIPEQLTHGVEGFHWALDDPEGAARLLITLLDDPVLHEQMSRNARARYERQFAPEVVLPTLLRAVLEASE
jgi:glycosyltransferase involved in cell wall biosynthesis